MKSKLLVISSVLAFGMIFAMSVAAQDQGSARPRRPGHDHRADWEPDAGYDRRRFIPLLNIDPGELLN